MDTDEFTRLIDRLQSQLTKFQTGSVSDKQSPQQQALEDLQNTVEELYVEEERLRQYSEELTAARDQADKARYHYEDLFESVPDGYLMTDREAVIHQANLAAAFMLATTPVHLAGKSLILFVVQEERQSFRLHLSHLTEHEQREEWEVHLQPQEGSAFPALVEAAVGRDPITGHSRLRWLARDITENKRVEARVRELEHYASTIFNTAREGIVIFDRDDHIVDFNRAFLELLGYSAVQLSAMTTRELTPPEFSSVDAQAKNRAFELGYFDEFEKELIKADGSRVPVSVNGAAIGGSPGSADWRLSAFVRDISGQKQVESRLREARDSLEFRVEERTAQLRSLAVQLIHVEDQERRRIAADLHDRVGQVLSVAQFKLGALRKAPSEADRVLLEELSELITLIGRDVHSLTFELSPPVLYELGLGAALEWLGEQAGKDHGLQVKVIDDS